MNYRPPFALRLACWVPLLLLAVFIFLRHFLTMVGSDRGAPGLDAGQDLAVLAAGYVIVRAIESFAGD